jgi:hypothetical protein
MYINKKVDNIGVGFIRVLSAYLSTFSYDEYEYDEF